MQPPRISRRRAIRRKSARNEPVTAALTPGAAAMLLFGIPRLLADIRIIRFGPSPEDVAVARDIGTGSLI